MQTTIAPTKPKKVTEKQIKERLAIFRDNPTSQTSDGERKSSEHLRVDLTDAEKLTYGQDLANLQAEIGSLEDDKKTFAKEFDAKIAAKEAAATSAANKIRMGYEMRNVPTLTFFDYPESGKKSTFRVDTGVLTETRLMTDEEKQRDLPLEPTNGTQPEPAT